jgi:hypothetical protein
MNSTSAERYGDARLLSRSFKQDCPRAGEERLDRGSEHEQLEPQALVWAPGGPQECQGRFGKQHQPVHRSAGLAGGTTNGRATASRKEKVPQGMYAAVRMPLSEAAVVQSRTNP